MITLYKKLDKTRKAESTITIDSALSFIKSSDKSTLITDARRLGKYDTNKSYIDPIRKLDKSTGDWSNSFVERNLYDHIKSTAIPVVTWAAQFPTKRAKSVVKDTDLSSFIYFDIDDFSGKSPSLDEIKEIFKEFPFTKSVWKSFGGKGLGILVKFNGLTVANFKATWLNFTKNFGEKFNINFDSATKDVTRVNVLSFDPNIYINKNCTEHPSCNDIPKLVTVTSKPMSKTMTNTSLNGLFDSLYNNPKMFNGDEQRLTYSFYQTFFGKTNQLGVVFDESFAFLVEKGKGSMFLFKHRSESKVYEIGENQYYSYADQFGEWETSEDKYVNVTSINNVFKGNSEIYIDFKFNQIIKKLKLKPYFFARLLKNKGITKKLVVSFFETNQLDVNIVQSVYSNVNILFGIEGTSTNNLEDWKAKMESKGLSVVQIKKGQYGISTLKKIGNQIIDQQDNRVYNFLEVIIREAVNYHISKDILIDYLTEIYPKTINDYNVILDELYTYNSFKLGYKAIKKISVKEIAKRGNVETLHLLPNDKKMSTLGIDLKKNMILWGDTNAGKTTTICAKTKGKRVIAVPTTGLLDNIEEFFNASCFFEHKKNVQEGDELIVVTYSSFPNLLAYMKHWKESKISEYDLYFDEYHNFLVASGKNFRHRELTVIIQSFSLFKNFIPMTGTYLPIAEPKLKAFPICRVKWETPIVKQYVEVRYADQFVSLEKRLVKNAKNVLFLNNKKMEGKLGELIDFLIKKGWREDEIQLLNANEKTTDQFKNVVINGELETTSKIVICTSVIVEASSIYNTDVQTLHFLESPQNPIHPILYEQFLNRFRVKLPEDIYIYLPTEKDLPLIDSDFDMVAYQNTLIDKAEKLLNILDFYGNEYDNSQTSYFIRKSIENQLFGMSNLIMFNKKTFQYEIDYLTIGNQSLLEETKYCYKNRDFFEKLLDEYNWNLKEVVYDLESMDNSMKLKLKELKTAKKEALLIALNGVVDEVVEDGEETLLDTTIDTLKAIHKDRDLGEFHISFRSKIKYLLKNMCFEDAIQIFDNHLNEDNLNDNKWSTISRALDYQNAKHLSIKTGLIENSVDLSTPFSKSINVYLKGRLKDDFKDKKQTILSEARVCQITQSRLKENVGIVKSVKILSDYVNLSLVKNEKGINQYIVKGFKMQSAFTHFYKKYSIWLNKNKGIKFKLDDLTKVINKLRADSPILNFQKLNNRTTIKLLKELNAVNQHRTTNKKYLYSIDDKIPNCLNGVKLEPLRLIAPNKKHINDMSAIEQDLMYSNLIVTSTKINKEPIPF